MKKISQNTFNKGINMDLNPLTTPKDVLTDCLNGTIITYNGDEFNLQTEYGNSVIKVTGDDGENKDALPHGFIPLGVKEFNNILYIVAHNPLTRESRIGSFPSPQRYLPMNSKGDPLLNSRTITDIETQSNLLVDTLNINHGMSLLTSFLSYGDKYQIMIRLGWYDNNSQWPGTWDDAQDILQKFINNYGDTKSGYFDLLYYVMDDSGKLIPLDVTLTPGNKISTIEYTPTPQVNGTDIETNGSKEIFTFNGMGIITAVLVPKVIDSFDYFLQGYNSSGLKAKIIFDKSLVKDSNSGIKVYTVKIVTTCSNKAEESVTYFDYKVFRDSLDTRAEVVLENLPVAFVEGDVLTTTCTPIDQFGRLLSDVDAKWAVTKTYTVSKYLFGVDAHDLFKYRVVGNNLVLTFNFLNTEGEFSYISTAKVEFYDFWSDVSFLSAPLTLNIIDLSAEVTVPLVTLTATTVFDGVSQGGIPIGNISTSTSNILGKGLVTSIRRDHCYIVRIFGTADKKEYSVFQLLYTGLIPIFVDNYASVRNFGTIDIAEGFLNEDSTYRTLALATSGNLFAADIVDTPIAVPMDDTATYSTENGTPGEPYRLYGGPVMEEVSEEGKRAHWIGGAQFYRNIYNGSFKTAKEMESFGYHTFGDVALRTLGLPPNGEELPSSLFGYTPNKYFLVGGLKGTKAHNDFLFQLNANFQVSSSIPLEGTIEISPIEESTGSPLFFGYVNTKSLNKQITINENVYGITPEAPSFTAIYYSHITESLVWSNAGTYKSIIPSSKANIQGTIIEDVTNDQVKITELSLTSQRFTIGESKFASYVRGYQRNKLFSYFSLNQIQSTEVEIILKSQASNINLITKYSFFGSFSSTPAFSINNTVVDTENTVATIIGVTNTANNLFTGTITWDVAKVLSLVSLIPMAEVAVSNVFPTTLTSTSLQVPIANGGEIDWFYTDSPSNTVPQIVRNVFRSLQPSHLKIFTEEKISTLSTYSHLWRVDTFPFIALKDAISETYLTNLAVNQVYKEIVIAQYPSAPVTNTDASTSTLALTGNKVSYWLGTSTPSVPALTKGCFGTSALEEMSVFKFNSLISTWTKARPLTVKVVYDFTDPLLSEGLAKNIPWNYVGGLFVETPLKNISLVLQEKSPDVHKTLFEGVKATIDSSSYLQNMVVDSPTIKGLVDNTLIPIKRKYFKLFSSGAIYNVNNSPLSAPILAEETLRPILTVANEHSYGVPYYSGDPPTVGQITGTTSLKVGDNFGGGIIFKLLPEDANGIQHGLICAKSDLPETKICWVNNVVLTSGGTFAVYANNEDDGLPNFLAMKDNVHMNPPSTKVGYETYIIPTIVNFRGEGNLYSDWYLPTTREMISMFNSSASNLDLQFGKNYWTSLEKNCCDGKWWKKAYSVIKEKDGSPIQDEWDKENYFISRPIRKF